MLVVAFVLVVRSVQGGRCSGIEGGGVRGVVVVLYKEREDCGAR